MGSSTKRTAESEAVGDVPPPRRKKSKKSKKSSGISNIAALAQKQQAQKAEQSASGGARRGGKKKALTFKEGFDKNRYVLVNRPKGSKSGQYTDCELHLWEKDVYDKTPASKRMNPPKSYAAYPLPAGKVVGSFLLGGVGMKEPNWNPTNIGSWSHSLVLDYSKEQDPIPAQYTEDAWAQTQPAEAAEAGDILEDFQLFLAESAVENSLVPGVSSNARAFPGLMKDDGSGYKDHVTPGFIVAEQRKPRPEGKVECAMCIHKNEEGKRIVKLKTQAYFEYRDFDEWVTAMELTPAEKKLYLQAKTEDDKKSQLKEISRNRGVPFSMTNDQLHDHLSESVENRDAYAMALGWKRVLFDLKEPQSPYKLAKKELQEAQDAYKAASDEFHIAELAGLDAGRSADQDFREAKIARSKADARVKRARRALEIASKDKGKKEWRTVANCKEIQKTKDIVHYGDYVSPMVKPMGARSYSSNAMSTYIYLTGTILHIASRPKYEQELPEMIEGAHAVNEDSDEDEVMEDEDEDAEAEDGAESGEEGSGAEEDLDANLPDIA